MNGMQEAKDDEICRNDKDFIEALEFGMAPTAGWGCGIDRICMLFTGAQTIKEVIAFPMFRPSALGKGGKKADKRKK
jgi:lysyl-tRNA synthetase, class II